MKFDLAIKITESPGMKAPRATSIATKNAFGDCELVRVTCTPSNERISQGSALLASGAGAPIHLQCASGYDTLSLILEGAHEVVGVDLSDVHIDNARGASAQLQMPAQWYRCDVLETPSELDNTADLVYTGRGAINWLHDIDAWAGVVARLLRQGGVLSLFEDHPVSWLFSPESKTLEASGINYFGHAETSQGWPDTYIGDLGKPAAHHASKHERLWTLADVFQALTKASLVVEYLGEHNEEFWPAFPNLAAQERAKIPMTYSIIARKPK